MLELPAHPELGVLVGLGEVARARRRGRQLLEAHAGNQHVAHAGIEIAVAAVAQHQLLVGIVEGEAAGQGFDGLAQTLLRGCRSEEHTSEPQSLMRISYAVFCLKKKKLKTTNTTEEQ